MSFRRELKLSILISLYGLTPQIAQLSKKHHNRKNIFPKNFYFLNIKIRIMEKEGRRKEKRKLVTGLTYASIRTPTWYLA